MRSGSVAHVGGVHIEQGLLLLSGEPLVRLDRSPDIKPGSVTLVASVEDASVDIKLLGGNPQTLGEGLENLGAGLLQAALNLRQIRVADSRAVSQLSQ